MTEREAFEAWARSVGWPHYVTMPATKGPDFFSDLSWDVWQARAQTAQAGQVPSDVRADFERARADGAFSPAADCCPTWYATELRFEGWSAAIAAQGAKT